MILSKAYDAFGNVLPITSKLEEVRRAIACFDVSDIREEGAVIGALKKVRTTDKLRALELLARHLGMFRDNLKGSGDAGNHVANLNFRCIRATGRGEGV